MKTCIRHFLFSVLACAPAAVFAQAPGTVDPGFATNGSFIEDITGNGDDDLGFDGLALPDGRILVTGTMESGSQLDVILVRLLPDGTIDSSFANNGLAQYDLSIGGDDQGFRIARQNDGMILIGGITEGADRDVFVARVDADGNFDNTFGAGGIVRYDSGTDDYLGDMDLAGNGKIVMGNISTPANSEIQFIRFTSAGVIDSSFSADGIETVSGDGNMLLYEAVLTGNGDIYFCGTIDGDTALAGKILSAGGLDNSFDSDGLLKYQHFGDNSVFSDMVRDGSGNMWLCGAHLSQVGIDAFVVKMNNDGSFDTNFDTDGANEYFLTDGNTYLQFNKLVITTEGILCGGFIGNRYISVMFDFQDGGHNNNYGVNGVADLEANPSFESSLLQIINLDDNRVLFIGATETSTLDMGMLAVFVRNPETVSVQNESPVNLTIYPNPVTESFRLNLPGNEAVKSIQMYNMAGQLVHIFPSQNIYVLPAGLKSSTYILRIQMQHSEAIARISILN